MEFEDIKKALSESDNIWVDSRHVATGKCKRFLNAVMHSDNYKFAIYTEMVEDANSTHENKYMSGYAIEHKEVTDVWDAKGKIHLTEETLNELSKHINIK